MDNTGKLQINCLCSVQVVRTGRNQKFCTDCARKSKYKKINEWKIKKGLIKKPGVGKGGAQPKGKDSPFYKQGTGIFRRYLKKFCERCNSSKFLCAHHKDRNRKNNEPENIETLCKSCHQVEHRCFDNFKLISPEKKIEAAKKASLKRSRDALGRYA